ncbi:MAG TPA: hypothetical protein VFZ83_13785 [Acidimicrobiia bacterium]|nr:hypothetical protein [Acidimicrobiia bacterium]
MEAELPLPLLVPTPVRKRLRLLGGGVILLATSIYLVAKSSGSTRLFGVLSAAIWVVGLIAVWRVTSRHVVELRTDGFVDRSSLAGAGFVPWSATRRIAVESYAGQRLVAVHLDPTVSLGESRWRSRYRGLSRRFVPGEVWISEAVLPIDAARFAELMRAARAQTEGATRNEV